MKLSTIAVGALVAVGASAGSITIPMGQSWNAQEAQDILQCSIDTLNAFDRGVTGNKASCNLLRCLQSYADRYNRGGILAKLSQILDIVCVAAF